MSPETFRLKNLPGLNPIRKIHYLFAGDKMKKIFKISFFMLILLGTLGFGFINWQYNHFTPKEVSWQPAPGDLAYFQESYDQSRSSFIQAAQKAQQVRPDMTLGGLPLKTAADPDLTINYCHIPARKTPARLLILSSAVHGVEGYVGSAVQQMFLNELLEEINTDELGILLIHGVNPYGFKYFRRVSENNIDLNRNCSLDRTLFSSVNPGYATLKTMLNPQGPLNVKSLDNLFFATQAIWKIITQGMPNLRQAILQGQYQFEKGVYFGGKELDLPIQVVSPLIQEIAGRYDRIFCIDLHTGYGQRGTMHLFPNPLKDEKKKAAIETIFAGMPIDWGDGDDFYTVTGDFTTYVGTLVPEKEYLTMTFEFGTLDSQTTLGAVLSLHNVILENQGTHFGYASPVDREKTRLRYLEGYYPSSEAWRSKAIADARKVLVQAVSAYEKLAP